jgi:hypothetical protein
MTLPTPSTRPRPTWTTCWWIADYPEQALYCYLDLFHTCMHNPALRERWASIATPSIRRMLELVLSSEGRANLDPFLTKQ